MAAIVGTTTDSALAARGWQAAPMDAVVVIALSLALLGIVCSALMTIGVALRRGKQG